MVVVAAARDAAAGGGGEAHAAPMTSGDGGVGDEREGYEWVRAMCLGQVLHFHPGENREEK